MKTTSPYKTAAELGIEQWEHDGLVALIGPLSRDEFKIDMAWPGVRETHACGTAGCIGGWVDYKSGRDKAWSISSLWAAFAGGALRPLYYPELELAYAASAPQAARAIVNFLTLGDPRWDDVMAAPG